MNLKQELGRKFFHFMASIVPLSYFWLDYQPMLISLAALTGLSLGIDLGRHHWSVLAGLFTRLFGRWLRHSESNRLTGASYFLIGSLLTILIFPQKSISIAAILYLAWGDLAAALIGKAWGRPQFWGKSWPGSLACFTVSFGLGLWFFPITTALMGALAATLLEFLPLPPNDNLWIPLGSGFVLWQLTRVEFILPL